MQPIILLTELVFEKGHFFYQNCSCLNVNLLLEIYILHDAIYNRTLRPVVPMVSRVVWKWLVLINVNLMLLCGLLMQQNQHFLTCSDIHPPAGGSKTLRILLGRDQPLTWLNPWPKCLQMGLLLSSFSSQEKTNFKIETCQQQTYHKLQGLTGLGIFDTNKKKTLLFSR